MMGFKNRNHGSPNASEGKVSKERWLLTYSDLITLLMIFFLLMYTISNVNAQKFAALARSLAATLGEGTASLVGDATGSVVPPIIPGDANCDSSQEAKQFQAIQTDLGKYIQQEHLQGEVSVTAEERGVVVSFQDRVLFAEGSADLSPKALEVLRQVGKVLSRTSNYLRVEGHTDNRPIHTAQFRSNWELSVIRATNVVHVLVEQAGINPARISATGYGEYRPRVANDTAAHRALNRRVDIIVLKGEFRPSEPGATPNS